VGDGETLQDDPPFYMEANPTNWKTSKDVVIDDQGDEDETDEAGCFVSRSRRRGKGGGEGGEGGTKRKR